MATHPGRFIIDVNLDPLNQYQTEAVPLMTWLTATEALRMLNVRPQTLYANVSRRRIRAKPDPKDPRRSLYHEADVRSLSRKQGGRRKSTVVAANAMEWGDPVLASSVSTVAEGRLYYRGRDAVALSESASLEEIAHLLWVAEAINLRFAWPEWASMGSDSPGPLPLERAFIVLGRRAGRDAASHGRTLPALQVEATGVLATLVDAMLDQGSRKPHSLEVSGLPKRKVRAVRSDKTDRAHVQGISVAGDEGHQRGGCAIHDRIANAWERPEAADMVRRALVLLADHELNASTFATRVAISTGAPLSAGVLSGLATLSGPLHGRAALGVREIMATVEQTGARVAVCDWLAQGRAIAGFGHPLYPAGDPRAAALLARLTVPAEYIELSDVVEELIGERPNVDFALAALSKVYRLPAEAPLMLFAVGRCVGWLAHALEQATTGHPIRPRARYVGPPIS
jgi:citrate synthase